MEIQKVTTNGPAKERILNTYRRFKENIYKFNNKNNNNSVKTFY